MSTFYLYGYYYLVVTVILCLVFAFFVGATGIWEVEMRKPYRYSLFCIAWPFLGVVMVVLAVVFLVEALCSGIQGLGKSFRKHHGTTTD